MFAAALFTVASPSPFSLLQCPSVEVDILMTKSPAVEPCSQHICFWCWTYYNLGPKTRAFEEPGRSGLPFLSQSYSLPEVQLCMCWESVHVAEVWEEKKEGRIMGQLDGQEDWQPDNTGWVWTNQSGPGPGRESQAWSTMPDSPRALFFILALLLSHLSP